MKSKTPEELAEMVKSLSSQFAQRREIAEKLKEMGKGGDLRKSPELRELRKQQQALNEELQGMGVPRRGKNLREPETDPRWTGFRRDLVRASELQSPAPPGHLLRDFGQSDRALIDNANDDPAVTQALTLLNGFVDQEILQPRSVIMKAVAAGKTQREQITAIFMSVLGREQTAKERPLQEIAGNWDQVALGDLVWSLVNSHEFLFIQ
jgi:hypothetical protein